jgi:hypothetical protein
MVSIITGISMSFVTSLVMQRAVVRRMLRMPPLPTNPPKLPTLLETRAAWYKYMRDSKQANEALVKGRKP